MSKEKKDIIGNKPIYDARKLGRGRMVILGLQHMFAMFGATVLVPILTGLDISTTLLCAGLGTLLFHVITGFKVPAFLGSSFAFLGGYGAVAPIAGKDGMTNAELLPYACLGVAAAGLVYLILAFLFKVVGVEKVMKFFPPVVTGPIIICIGLGLAGSAVDNCETNWIVAFVALVTIIIFNIWGKGMAKIVPIILGIGASYLTALGLYIAAEINPALALNYPSIFTAGGAPLFDFGGIANIFTEIGKGNLWGNLVGLPIHREASVLAIDWSKTSLIISAVVAIVPISLATMMEHIGDISAISSTCGKNYIKKPGLHRTLVGDGLATSLASLAGGPANTTYGENTGVLALTKVYDPKVVRIAAIFAVAVSFLPLVAEFIKTIPSAVIGGISFVLYGMISAVGVRNVVESKVDFTKSRNLIIAAIILVTALGLGAVSFTVFGITITLSALAVASMAGIFLNAIFPGKDYVYSTDAPADTGVSFAVGANTDGAANPTPEAVFEEEAEVPVADVPAEETPVVETPAVEAPAEEAPAE
ncbi:MAG: uracil-xanthine permease family protein [Oscillospiraceae bacterium]|nr:uracil-xanthine permease family protein [Oscillospiraceae bacterium]